MDQAPIRAVIADDEPLVRDSLRYLLRAHPDIEVVGEAADGIAAVDIVRTKLPDLVFLDVRMPEMNGFDVLEALSDIHLPVVIFVTAHDQYALQAFDVRALGYLLKPFTNARFESVLTHAKQQLRMVRTLEGPPPRRIAVRDGDRMVLIDLNQVDWIEANRNYSALHVGRHSYLVRTTLAALSSGLDPDIFVQIHRSTIVNIRRVREVVPRSHSDCELVLSDGSVLKVSRNYRVNLFTGSARVRDEIARPSHS